MPKRAAKSKRLGYTPEQIAAGAAARDRASNGNPRAVLDALAPDAVTVCGFTLQPVTMSVIIQLQKAAPSLMKSDNTEDFLVGDIAKALFILTQPIKQVRQLLVSDRFEEAVDAMADEIPASHLKDIGAAVNSHIETAFATLIPHAEKGKDDPNSPFAQARPQAPGTDGSLA